MRRYLLRSKSFWLGLFACAGIVWAWVDSETHISGAQWNSSRFCIGVSSGSGGFFLGIDPTNPFLSSGFHCSRGPMVEVWGRTISRFSYYPNFLWSHTLILSVSIWTTWLVWRYRRMQRLIAERDRTKFTNAPPESNSPNP